MQTIIHVVVRIWLQPVFVDLRPYMEILEQIFLCLRLKLRFFSIFIVTDCIEQFVVMYSNFLTSLPDLVFYTQTELPLKSF